MQIEKADFNKLVEQAATEENLKEHSHFIRKELLHYDILFALQREGLLEGVVFQGGTSLRLCYDSVRFSQDLDFAAGRDFPTADMMAVKTAWRLISESGMGSK